MAVLSLTAIAIEVAGMAEQQVREAGAVVAVEATWTAVSA